MRQAPPAARRCSVGTYDTDNLITADYNAMTDILLLEILIINIWLKGLALNEENEWSELVNMHFQSTHESAIFQYLRLN